MKKIKHYNGNNYTFHTKIVNSLHNQNEKKTIIGIDSKIKNAYNNYNTNFNNNSRLLLLKLVL